MQKLNRIISLLRKEYGESRIKNVKGPLEELVLTLLSQNTTDKNSRRAYENLMRLGPIGRLLNMPERKIARAIKVGGLNNIKAHRIKEILGEIEKRTSGLGLSFLRRKSTAAVLEFLRSLKGVGPKTAACVALFSLKKPVMPVDTHILRISKRLGLIPENTSLSKAHELLGEFVPVDKNLILSFHINMIRHGRQICHARNPECERCILRGSCNYCRLICGNKRRCN